MERAMSKSKAAIEKILADIKKQEETLQKDKKAIAEIGVKLKKIK
jgi:hypothetical protein